MLLWALFRDLWTVAHKSLTLPPAGSMSKTFSEQLTYVQFTSFFQPVQSWAKYLRTFSCFSTIFLHHKWNETGLFINRKWRYELPYKFLSVCNFWVLVNYVISRKSPKCLELLMKTQLANRKPNFDSCARILPKVIGKKFPNKHFVNVFTIFCPRLQIPFITLTGQNILYI